MCHQRMKLFFKFIHRWDNVLEREIMRAYDKALKQIEY